MDHTLAGEEDERSSHWYALSIFANTKMPSGLCSCKRLFSESCGMTLDINCELLLTRFVFGFFLFTPSFPATGAKRILSSPNTGVRPAVLLDERCVVAPLPFVSFELLDSFSLSLILYVPRFDLVLVGVLAL